VPSTYDAIEAAFAERRDRAPALGDAYREALDHVTRGAALAAIEATLAEAGHVLAHVIDQAAPPVEPAYHNRHHMAEATLAMAMLCREAMAQGLLSRRDALVGIVAMVGHDMHHDGSCAAPGVMEARSRQAVENIMATAGVVAPLVHATGSVIAATDPTRLQANRLRAQRDTGGEAILPMLANEADVFASVLPSLGPRLSILLAEEWRAAGRSDLLPAGVTAARSIFLRAYPPFSPAAQALGLEDARAASLAAAG
jgi:hypothetical protein